MSVQVALARVISSLSRALNLHMLGFYLLGAIITALVCTVLVWAGEQVGPEEALVMLLIAAVVWTGMFMGVLPGGVAYLTQLEERGHTVRFLGALAFCGRRFPSLFGGAILLLILCVLMPLIVNGMITLLNSGGNVGSVVGALLTIPQVLANLILVVSVVAAVILPCAIAVEDIGAISALSRLASCLRRHTRSLIVQLALTLFFGILVLIVLVPLVGMAVAPTIATNGPRLLLTDQFLGSSSLPDSNSGFGADWNRFRTTPSSSRRRGPGALSSSQSGDSLRLFFLALVALTVAAYPTVYFVVSFTAYYETIRRPVPEFEPPVQPSGP